MANDFGRKAMTMVASGGDAHSLIMLQEEF
jgi:hypothetical protein